MASPPSTPAPSLAQELDALRAVGSAGAGLLDAILEHSPYGIIVADAAGRLLLHNPAALRIWGGSAPTASIDDWSQYRAFHDDGRPFEGDDWAMARALRTGETVPPHEIRVRRFDGTDATLLGSSAPLRTQSGELVGALSIFADVTELRAAQGSLRLREHRFRQILDAVQDMVFCRDRGLRIVYANQATCRHFGMTPEELRGQPLPSATEAVRDDAEVLRTGCVREAPEEPQASANGELRWFHTIKSPLFGPDGTVQEVVAVSRDVTERRRAEQRLRAHHAVARIIAEATSPADAMPLLLAAVAEALGWELAEFWRLDEDTHALCCVAQWAADPVAAGPFLAAAQGLTFPRGEGLPGLVWERGEPLWMADVTLDEAFPRRTFLRDAELPSAFAFPVVAAGRGIGVVTFYARHIPAPERELLRMADTLGSQVGQFLERARAEDERRAREAAMRRDAERRRFLAEATALLGSSLDEGLVLSSLARLTVPVLGDWCAIDVVDAAGALRRVAVAHTDPDKVALARAIHERYPADMNAPSGVPAVLRSGRTEWQREVPDELLQASAQDPELLRILRDLGLRSYMVLPLAARGRVLGAVTLVTAESERRYTEEDVAFAEDLARRAALSVENARLYGEAQALIAALEQSNRELDQFAYVTSHDLKAPLRGIASIAEWIEEDLGTNLQPETKRQLALLTGRVRRMEGLIQGILDYSRAARVRGKAEEIAVDALLHDVIDLVSSHTAAVVEIVPPMPVVFTERVPLQQVLMNLVSNGIRHARRSDAHVRVEARDQGDFVEIAVTDNGPGIAPEYHERIWGIFKTLEARDRVESTGIGLAIVRKIVEARGGRAWVESTPGAGATFRFTWPKRDAPLPA